MRGYYCVATWCAIAVMLANEMHMHTQTGRGAMLALINRASLRRYFLIRRFDEMKYAKKGTADFDCRDTELYAAVEPVQILHDYVSFPQVVV